MWQISRTRWLNPLAIRYVVDSLTTLTVYFGSAGDGLDCEEYRGEERLVLLAFLAQHSQQAPLPRPLVLDDDAPPF